MPPRARTWPASTRAQSPVFAELKRRQIPITGTGQVLVNAIFVSATPETAAELRSLPGVAYVTVAPQVKPDLDRAVTLQNVLGAWAVVGGASNAGAGIKIGIIDSGIDLNHAGFQDAAPPAARWFSEGRSQLHQQ